MAISGRGDFQSFGTFFHIILQNDHQGIKTARPYSRLWIIAGVVTRLNPSSFWKSDRPKKNRLTFVDLIFRDQRIILPKVG